MSDSDSQDKGAIPSWQKQSPEPSTTTTTTENDEDSSKIPKETRMAQARKFLQDDEVRNTSTPKQISFLESKGYTADEINELLGVERNTEASVSEQTAPIPNTEQRLPQQTTSNNTPASSSPPQIIQTRQEAQPPIITYPEFLIKPTAPSPLITSSRLLTTLSLFSSLSLILYGSNKYLLTPMQESLTQSRHELLTKASEHLSTLNEKLSNIVSEQPDSVTIYKDQEDEESDGDPTEMFHRDIGIQTSPSLLDSSPSRSSSPSTDSSDSPLESHLSRMSILSSHLNEINSASTSEGADAAELTTTIDVVREYLESMAFIPPTYTYSAPAYGGLVRDMVGGSGAGKEEPDEIAQLKASIRSVKGVLLSARSFPSTGRGNGIMGVR